MKNYKYLFIAEFVATVFTWLVLLFFLIKNYSHNGDVIFEDISVIPYFFSWLFLSVIILWLMLQWKYIFNKFGNKISGNTLKGIKIIPYFLILGILLAVIYNACLH